MVWPLLSKYPAVKLAGAFALGCVVALILAAGGSAPAQPSRTTRPSPRPVGAHLVNTPAGAATVATAWCQLTAEAFVAGSWSSAVDALATGPFRTLALRYQPVAALVHQRLVEARAPYALRVWPLGYAVARYSATFARVRVWQLYVLATSGPEAVTEFTTTTVSLQWAGQGWKVTGAPAGADLAPPDGRATPNQVATWVRAANEFEGYRHVP